MGSVLNDAVFFVAETGALQALFVVLEIFFAPERHTRKVLGEIEIRIARQIFTRRRLRLVIAAEMGEGGCDPAIEIGWWVVQFFPHRYRVRVTPCVEVGNDINGAMPLLEVWAQGERLIEPFQCLLRRAVVVESLEVFGQELG